MLVLFLMFFLFGSLFRMPRGVSKDPMEDMEVEDEEAENSNEEGSDSEDDDELEEKKKKERVAVSKSN